MPPHSSVSRIFDHDAKLKKLLRIASLCRMVSARYLSAHTHDGDVRRHDQPSACCFAYRLDCHARSRLSEDKALVRRFNHGHLGDNEVTGRKDVAGPASVHPRSSLALHAWFIATMTRRAPLTRSIVPPMPGTRWPGNHPVGQAPIPVDLQPAENGHIEVPATDQGERGCRVECDCAGSGRDEGSLRRLSNARPPCLQRGAPRNR